MRLRLGAWGVRGPDDEDMVVLEDEFVAEVLEIGGDHPVAPQSDGTLYGELVLTNLGRIGSPVVRYHTGDVVRLHRDPGNGGFATLRGGILSRADGMMVVRGINVYPSAIENLVREIAEIVEFRAVVHCGGEMARLRIEIEVRDGDGDAVAQRLAALLHRHLHLNAEIEVAAAGSLPRFELKAKRFTIVEG